jgi:multisubunit Na+/H+ antiporter MnhC subunit
MAWMACRVTGLPLQTYLREVWLRPAFALVAMLLFGIGLGAVWVPRSLLETILQLAVAGVALSAVAFAIGLDREERATITSRFAAWTAGLKVPSWSR